jgi:hypothetical protein
MAFEGTTDPIVKRLNSQPDPPAPQSMAVRNGRP